jgi:hypothetical protein
MIHFAMALHEAATPCVHESRKRATEVLTHRWGQALATVLCDKN